MPNDVVPKSALPSPILDRFRLLLKELRFSGDDEFDDVVPPTTEEFVRIYEDVLSELTINSKPIITDLTIIAGDFREHAEGIAHSICARILEVPVEQKLPSLYLLDSIVKNIGRDYIRHFASDLPVVFCEVYRQVPPNMHASMRHLFGTWSTVFPSSVLRQIEDELQLSSPRNQPSSSLASLRASESPRPSHGIHVNPEYLKARHQLDTSAKNNIQLGRGVPNLMTLSKKDSPGYEDFDYEQGENSDAQRFQSIGIGSRVSFQPSVDKLLPSVSGSGRPLSPSVDNFSVSNSPGRVFERESPSHYGRRVRAREEEIVDLQKRHRTGGFNYGRENVAAFSLSNDFDRDRPRALIDAYGHDDGQRSLNKKRIGLDRQIVNGTVTKVAENSWQNTEEEEFDWEDMSPTLADGKINSFNQSSIPSTRGLLSRPFDHSSRSNWGNSAPMLRIDDPQTAVEDANQIQDVASNLHGTLAASLEKLPVAGREHTSQLNINGAPQYGNHFKPDLFSGSIRAPSPQGSQLSTGIQPPISLHSMMPLPPLYPQQKQTRPSFEFMNSTFTVLNQGPQQFENGDNTRNSFSINPPQRPQPGYVPLLHQPRPPVSFPQQSPLSQEHRPRPPNFGYPQQGLMASTSNIRNNPVHAFHSSPFQNASNNSMQFRGPVPPIPTVTRPYSLIMPLPQTSGSVANQPASANISGLLNSGLLNSLVAQGLFPQMKQPTQQDSVGVEFDPDLIKVRHESAIRALYEDLPRQCTTCGLRFKTQDEHSKHMDWHVTKNRISKNRKHNPSRKWFVSASMWLSGTEALGIDATPGFLPAETAVEKKDDEEMAVPADEDQTACYLCGEPFEDFYSDETEEWMYRGAVYLNSPYDGTALGMDRSQLGPIIHAKCRSEPTSAPS
ncbi:hypothetical protein RND81_10G014300 [Saponaria officinalis]|uniref:CID domain-containing protein n=1 Tax=Saponaria officinalis TaxID=3572 RepID=A0AAW1HZ45_SAPOF